MIAGKVAAMSLALDATPLYRPPAPVPRAGPQSFVRMIHAMATNPITVWRKIHFEEPIIIGPTPLGMRAVISDPAAIKRVFLDNAANYTKDALQLRLLAPGLGRGLLTSTGDDWRR